MSIAGQPAHTVDLDHRGTTYRVEYRPHVEARLRTIGMSAGTRQSTQQCVVATDISIERVIAGKSGQELKSLLPNRESFRQNLPGSCHGRDAQTLVAAKSDAMRAHMARAAAADRVHALAAIDSAHHFAAN